MKGHLVLKFWFNKDQMTSHIQVDAPQKPQLNINVQCKQN